MPDIAATAFFAVGDTSEHGSTFAGMRQAVAEQIPIGGLCGGPAPANGRAIANRLATEVIDDKDGRATPAHLDWMR